MSVMSPTGACLFSAPLIVGSLARSAMRSIDVVRGASPRLTELISIAVMESRCCRSAWKSSRAWCASGLV